MLIISSALFCETHGEQGDGEQRDQRDVNPYLGQARADARAPDHNDPHDAGYSRCCINHVDDVEQHVAAAGDERALRPRPTTAATGLIRQSQRQMMRRDMVYVYAPCSTGPPRARGRAFWDLGRGLWR